MKKSRLFRKNTPLPYGVLFLIFALLPVIITTHNQRGTIIYILIYCLGAASLRFVSISGQLSFAQGAFMGIGAYSAGICSKFLGIPWLITIPLGAVIAALIGIITAYPFTRLRSVYYTMCSLFLGNAIILAITVCSKWTGGATGMTGIKGISNQQLVSYYVVLGVVALCLAILYRVEYSQIGDNFRAIAQAHQVASSVGINERAYRIFGVAMGSFFGGVAGALYAHYGKILTTSSFDLDATLWLFMYVLVGGSNSFAGPIIGTILLRLIPEVFRGLGMYSDYVSVAALFIVVYALPKGLAGLPELTRKLREKRRGSAETNNARGDENAA